MYSNMHSRSPNTTRYILRILKVTVTVNESTQTPPLVSSVKLGPAVVKSSKSSLSQHTSDKYGF